MNIHILSPDVAAKIAAGEVVERPASVVKELVENALDAGAKTVRVETQQGGKRLIRIMDDGCGISEAEIPLVFARHATSKLTFIEDLSRITTLGFRGEALASIAAVSKITVVSRPLNQTAATRLCLEGGQETSLGSAGAPVGTVISVENLFYNVPARLKFLKAEATETGHIYRVVTHYAMAYPQVRFSLQNDGRTTFQSNGSGQLFDALVSVFGLETARQMIEVNKNDFGFSILDFGLGEDTQSKIQNPKSKIPSVYGYTSMPALHRGTRDQLIFFVNKRWIQDRSLNQAVIQAYHTFLQVERYPVAVINIELEPSEVDINVHPTKAEVKFQEPRLIFKKVQQAIREVVVAASPVPAYQMAHAGGGQSSAWSFGGSAPSNSTLTQFGLDVQRTLPPEGENRLLIGLPMMRVIGQVQQMYLIAEGPDGLYLIDQHAAHERVLYEKLSAQKAKMAVARQQLLEPLVVELTPGQAAMLEAEQDALTEVGFDLEPFGGFTYRIRAMPEILGQAEPGQALIDILAEMVEGAIPLAKEVHEKIAITVCKRGAIKGGQILSPEEMRELVRQLEATTAPRTCPHGRPTMIHLSLGELARQFGRL